LQVAMSGALMNDCDGIVTEQDQVQRISQPVISAPRSSPTSRFVRLGVWITVDCEKIVRLDELGALLALSS
jgi:hypothetical protein